MFERAQRPWLSDQSTPYSFHRPGLYDPSQFDFVKIVESQWQVIRDELLEAIGQSESTTNEFRPYRDLEKTDKEAAWKTAGLMYWTIRSKKNISLFPKTWQIFQKIPNLTSCSIHLLEPHATIKPHVGDTDAMYRCHMGLIVPAQLPRCGFRVGNEKVSWEEGKVFIFNDAYNHTAWNNTNNNRYVISFDVMRKEHASQKYWVASQVLGKINIEVLMQHQAWLRRHFSGKHGRALAFFLSKAYWRIKIFMNNNFLGGRCTLPGG